MSSFMRYYLENLYNETNDLEGFNLEFKDKVKEEEYKEYFKDYEINKSRIYLFFSTIANLSWVFLTLRVNQFNPHISTYLLIFTIISDVIFTLFSKRIFESSKRMFFIIKYLRYIMTYCFNMYGSLFSMANDNLIYRMKYFFSVFIYLNFLFIYYLDFSYFVILIYTCCNVIIVYFIDTNYIHINNILNDIIGTIGFSTFCFFLKKNEHFLKKNFFSNLYKKQRYLKYVQELVDVINTMIININKDFNIIYLNKISFDFFNKSNIIKQSKTNNHLEERIETIEKIDLKEENFKSDSNEMNNSWKTLSNSLFLCDKLSDDINCEKRLSLYEIIKAEMTPNECTTKEFKKLGYFNLQNEGNNLCYEIFLRKIKINEEIIELLIYDVSGIKEAEKNKVETKYKQKFLAKIAHEFKTPLIAIITLISKLQEKYCKNCGNKEKDNLNHINNLSNYTLNLISDIIHYVSGLEIKINLQEINIKETIYFCYDILKTLVQCKLFNTNNVETKLEMEENIENIKIITDENRFKQILLNFISNSVKFTKKGDITIKTLNNHTNNTLDILVIDSGIGIKNDDQHLVFQENIQFNIEENYNTKGSGLGLSICKSMANLLGHEVRFSSVYKEGSKFYLTIKYEECKEANDNIYIMNDISLKDQLDIENFCHLEDLVKVSENKNEILISDRVLLEEDSDSSLIPQSKSRKYSCMDRIEFKYYEGEMHKSEKSKRIFQSFEFLEICEMSNFSLCVKLTGDDYPIWVVVDDNKLVRENSINLLKSVLSGLNVKKYRIKECSDGIELLSIIINDIDNRIKCIFIDESMEYMNGSETVRIIRKLEERNKIHHYYIVSITAFDDQSTKNDIIKSGVNEILTKPCSKSSLMIIIKNILK